MERLVFWVALFVGFIGLVSLCLVVVFGFYIFKEKYTTKEFFFKYMHGFPPEQFSWNTFFRELPKIVSDFLDRRNEFWMTFSQAIIATLIITTLTLLLLTKTISAEAGLPILSGISGFALGKGITFKSTSGHPE